VYSVRAGGNGHINPVVYDEQHAGLCRALSEYFGQPEKIPLADIFFPELNNARPAFDEAIEDFEVGAAVGKPLTGDRIDVNRFETGFSFFSSHKNTR
jgi:hypothetical protein